MGGGEEAKGGSERCFANPDFFRDAGERARVFFLNRDCTDSRREDSCLTVTADCFLFAFAACEERAEKRGV